jgi:DNA-binding beta-propeller fold protein YncE
VTADASVNDITLKIGSTAGATFTPATTVVDQSQASTVTGSLVYLNLTPLKLTAQEFSAISPAAEGWQVVPFPTEQVLGMTPEAAVTIGSADTIDIKIGPLAAAYAEGSSASLVVNVYRVSPVTVGNLVFPTNFSVSLATPPHAGDQLSQDLQVELVTPDVVNSVPGYDNVENQLSFAFFAGPRGRPVTPTADTQFNLSFVYSTDPSGYGALCTTDQVKPPFEVVAGVNAGDWTITPNRLQQSPSWTLRPPTTGPIVSAGPRSTVGILASNLVTTFQPGPTVALISYSGLPGYADGVFTLLISKHGHVTITSLAVQPNPSVLKDGAAEVKITWTVENAGTMTLAPFDVDVTGKTSYSPATITETTQISLTAQGTYLASQGNIALRNTTARVLPVINSFTADPRSVYSGDLPRDVALSWNVNTNEQLQLLSSTGPPDPTKYGKYGAISKPVSGPQMFTLLPLGQSGGPAVERSIVISAFTPQARSWPVHARFLAAPPNASFVLASDGNGAVVAVDTMVYQPVSANIQVGATPAGMVFSADGSTLYVANSGDGTISGIAVAATGTVPQYSFTTQSTTTVGGAPQDVVLSPDGAYLYVTVDGGTAPGRLVVLSAGPIPSVVGAVPVGVAPRGVAVMPSGAQVFVANSGSSTVTVVGRAPDGQHSVVDTVTGVNSAQDVAVTIDGNVLLVACPTANSVIAINAVHPEAGRQILAVGASPQHLALLPSGAYAVVTSQGDGTASLLAVGGTPALCRVLKAGLAAGPGASAVTVTPDAGLALVGTTAGLSVLTLAEYQTAQKPPAIGGQPTGVVISPDGMKVAGWHNALQTFSLGKPSTGLFVYDVSSETVTPQLASTKVVDLAYHPVAAAKTAFLVDSTHQAVQVLSTSTWTASGTIDLSGQTSGKPVALAISADGTTLFVLLNVNDEQCQLASYGASGSPPGYAPLGVVTVLSSTTPGSTLTIAAAPDGSAAYVTDQESGNLLVVARAKDGTYVLTGDPVPVGDYPLATALSPDGSRLYVACEGITNGSLADVLTRTLAVRGVMLPATAYTSLAGLAVSPDGSRVLATDLATAGVRVFDAASLRLVQTITWSTGVQMPGGIAITPDASRIFTANTTSGNLGVIAQVQGSTAMTLGQAPGPSLGTAGALAGVAALGDDPYQGLFIRDYVGQTPQSGNQTGAVTTCPDIWPSGQQLLTDPKTTLASPAGYGTQSPDVIYTSEGGVNNYIYVRGINATSGPGTSRVWLYYLNGGGSSALILWPPSWLNKGVTALDTGVGYVDVPSAALNEVDFTYPPFIWNAVPVTGHYCIIAWVENPPLSDPPTDPRAGIGSIGTMDQLASFIENHPNMGWKNTVDVPTATGETWEQVMPLQGPPKGGLFRAGLQLTNVPTDGFFSFSIAGPTPTPKGSVNVPKTPITDPNQTYLVPLDWTGSSNYSTNMIVTYYAGKTAMPPGSNIQPTAATPAKGLVGLVRDPGARAFRARVYPTHRAADGYQQEWLITTGMVQFNLTPPT